MKTKQKLKLNYETGLNFEAGLLLCVDTPVICAVERLTSAGRVFVWKRVFNALEGNEFCPVCTDR